MVKAFAMLVYDAAKVKEVCDHQKFRFFDLGFQMGRIKSLRRYIREMDRFCHKYHNVLDRCFEDHAASLLHNELQKGIEHASEVYAAYEKTEFENDAMKFMEGNADFKYPQPPLAFKVDFDRVAPCSCNDSMGRRCDRFFYVPIAGREQMKVLVSVGHRYTPP